MNLSITLSDHEAAAMSSVVTSHPQFNTHSIHKALLRLGLRSLGDDPSVLVTEVTRIQQERRDRRRGKLETPQVERSPGSAR